MKNKRSSTQKNIMNIQGRDSNPNVSEIKKENVSHVEDNFYADIMFQGQIDDSKEDQKIDSNSQTFLHDTTKQNKSKKSSNAVT